ncbi:MAG: hypothetical protein ABI759_05235 [Candidatus Solibacter sp.]
MGSSINRPRLRTAVGVVLAAGASVALSVHFLSAQTAQNTQKTLEKSFHETVEPFFQKNCQSCHNSDLRTAGVRTDQLDTSMDERQLKTWEAVRGQLSVLVAAVSAPSATTTFVRVAVHTAEGAKVRAPPCEL